MRLDPAIPPERQFLFAAGLWAAVGTHLDDYQVASLDAAQVLMAARHHKMLPFVAYYAEARLGTEFEGSDTFLNIYGIANRLIYRELEAALTPFCAQGGEAMLLKGADLDLHFYPPTLPRAMNDVDILVRPPELELAVDAFESVGFTQSRLDRSAGRLVPLTENEKRSIAQDHYELAPLCKLVRCDELLPFCDTIRTTLPVFPFVVIGDRVYVSVACDIHFNISADFDLEDVWFNPRHVKLPGGSPVLAQSYTDLFWFLAARMYHEVLTTDGASIRQFIDLLAIVRNSGSVFDWLRMQAMVDKYELHPSLYYSCIHIQECLGDANIPADFIGACFPAQQHVRRLHDWGDFIPKMFGFVSTAPLGVRGRA